MIRASIGPYQLVRRLGHGGMAEVFLAISHGASGFEHRVAIKVLLPERAEPALERALIREATIGGALAHRNLVAVLGLGTADGAYYVVMEYVDGGDLASQLRDRTLPPPLALHVVGEVARGLAHLHAATDARGLPLGLVHRDVSPANVLVSTTGDVKLGDFGVAKATALVELTAAGTRKGRYAYMAPELLAGEPVGQAGDQFALAVMLVELVAGHRPFPGDTPWALVDAIATRAPDLDGLPDGLVSLARRALARAPSDRFASMAELAAAFTRSATDDLAAWVHRT
ncbi:MAG: serine/threonine-protein kinase [Proteobacteria bacterium]|nr:serine/threonine-protein kinase [Pseudomonadota bacterium]